MAKKNMKLTKVKPSGEPDFEQEPKEELPEVEESEEPKEELPRPQSVTVRFKGPGFGILAGKQVLTGEVYPVSWTQWLAVKNNNKYERVDV